MFPTPPHLQCPTSQPPLHSASCQSSTPPQQSPATRCAAVIPVIQPSLPATAPPDNAMATMCTTLIAVVGPTPPSPLAVVASMTLQEAASSGNPARQGSSEPVAVCPLQLTIGNNAVGIRGQLLATMDDPSASMPNHGSYDWTPPEGMFLNCHKIFVTDHGM